MDFRLQTDLEFWLTLIQHKEFGVTRHERRDGRTPLGVSNYADELIVFSSLLYSSPQCHNTTLWTEKRGWLPLSQMGPCMPIVAHGQYVWCSTRCGWISTPMRRPCRESNQPWNSPLQRPKMSLDSMTCTPSCCAYVPDGHAFFVQMCTPLQHEADQSVLHPS
jgi:hypothetical protein